MNNTTEKVPQVPLTTVEIIALSQLTTIFIVGTIGNLLVIYVFGWKKRNRRRSFDLLLLILGIADFLASCIAPSLIIYVTVTRYRQWHFGYYGCKILHSLFPMSITISQGILVLISYERCKVIRDPFSGRMRKPVILLCLLCIFLLAVFMVSPYTISLSIVTDHVYNSYTCVPTNVNYPYLLIYSTMNCLRDVTATSVLIVFGVVSHNQLKMGPLINLRQRRTQKRFKNAKKARRMLIIVTCVFSICVIPLDIFQLVFYSLIKANVSMSTDQYQAIVSANTFLIVLQTANSATNIIIYSKMHQDFTRNLCVCATKGKHLLRESMSRFSTSASSWKSQNSEVKFDPKEHLVG